MTYVRLEDTFYRHVKFRRLARALGVGEAQAHGHMSMLWSWALVACPDGDLADYDAADLEEIMMWTGTPGMLFESLIGERNRFLDLSCGRALIHDWKDYTEGLKRADQKKESRARVKSARQTVTDARQTVTDADTNVCAIGSDQIGSDQNGSERISVFPETQRTASSGTTSPEPSDPDPGPDVDLDVHHEPQDAPSPAYEPPSKAQVKPKKDRRPTALAEALKGERVTPKEEAVLTYQCDGPEREWHLSPSKLSEWKAVYPSLDVLQECRRANQWIADSPERRKTARGMPRFLGAWMGRAQDRSKATNGQTKPKEKEKEFVWHDLPKATWRT